MELLEFAQSLCAASSLAELKPRFAAGFGRLMGVPMFGFYVRNPWTGRFEHLTSTGVSDIFLARYERFGREIDPLEAHQWATGGTAYNMELMTMEEWLETPFYRRAAHLHEMRQLMQTPVVNREGIVGDIRLGTSDPRRGFTPHEVQLAEAVGGVVGTALERIHSYERLERERDQTQAALNAIGCAVVLSDRAALEPRLNDAARRLLAEVVDGQKRLYDLIAHPPGARGGFSRHVEVELVSGGTALIAAHSGYMRREGGVLITVLELQPDDAQISAATLTALTPREREVALRVADGLTDVEIAERLNLSPHTVRQHVKRIYRKLGVGSRVALTRMLLAAWHPRRRS